MQTKGQTLWTFIRLQSDLGSHCLPLPVCPKTWDHYGTYELRQDKTNRMSVHPAKTQISLGICPVWSESSLSMWRKLGSLATHWVHSEDFDQTVRPAKTQISLGIRVKKAWILSYPLSAQPKLWSDWVDAQANLSLCWVHSHFVGFVMSQLIIILVKTPYSS